MKREKEEGRKVREESRGKREKGEKKMSGSFLKKKKVRMSVWDEGVVRMNTRRHDSSGPHKLLSGVSTVCGSQVWRGGGAGAGGGDLGDGPARKAAPKYRV